MNSFEKQLNDSLEHGDKMHASGVKYGKVMVLSDLTHDILVNNYTEVSEVLAAISDMKAKINLGGSDE